MQLLTLILIIDRIEIFTDSHPLNFRKPAKKSPTKAAREEPLTPDSGNATAADEHKVVKRHNPEAIGVPSVGIPEKFITSTATQKPENRAKPAKVSSATKKTTTKRVSKPQNSSTKQGSTPSPQATEKPKAQGILYGMASLKRIGNVKVIPEGVNSTIKSRFSLGPLTLRVEKSIKRGTVRSVKSATARTNEMIGRITLRVVNGEASVVSIKVQQPKQVSKICTAQLGCRRLNIRASPATEPESHVRSVMC